MPHALSPPPLRSWGDLVDLALSEDLGPGDVTSNLVIAEDATGEARIEARAPMVACGLFVVQQVMHRVGEDHPARSVIATEPLCLEGQEVEAGQPMMRLRGSLRGILAGERTALNFLGRMCGVATLTHRYVREVAGTETEIVDTRKTLPGYRALDKFAVQAGGGTNHRYALYDGILLKDNHVAAAGSIASAVKTALHGGTKGLRLQVEVESLEQAHEACGAGADFLLLDNCTPDEVREIVRAVGERALLEASGGITLDNLRSYAETGVNRISLGVLTHSAPASDVALELGAFAQS